VAAPRHPTPAPANQHCHARKSAAHSLADTDSSPTETWVDPFK